MTVLRLERETVEFLPHTMIVKDENGVVDEDAVYQLSAVPHGQRPTIWGSPPYLISGYSPGYYDVYGKVLDAPETPVVFLGSFVIA